DASSDLQVLLPLARGMTLLFWWLLLVYARLCGRQLAGAWGGRMAVAFLAVEPSLLAHASLATTDLALTACLLALVYHFRSGRDQKWLRRVGLPSFWFAAAILAKASGLIFGPLCLAVVELERLLNSDTETGRQGDKETENPPAPWLLVSLSPCLFARSLGSFRRDIIQILIGGLLLAFLYCGCDWQTQPSFVKWAEQLPEGPSGHLVVWLSEHLRIFSNAGEGLVRQVKHNIHGHGAYLFGQVAPRSIWYYFPAALTVKLSLTLLVLPAVLLVTRP